MTEDGVGREVEEGQSQNVKVALNIRPLIAQEQIEGCGECISVVPGEPQVQIGLERFFTYDYVYGSLGKPLGQLFQECVAPLVEGLFSGYNGTVLAYGQTGSGKTYTMGSGYSVGGSNSGVIPQAMKMLFAMVERRQDIDFQIKVSYIEIHKEDVRDLLELVAHVQPSGKAAAAASGKGPVTIRETSDGGITLAGVSETEVFSISDMAACLEQGSLCRATGSTSMNSHSSRSHAIFTISLEQHQRDGSSPESSANDHLCAKLHLVDLAGSERAKRTKADGQRLQEGIHINKGLLALGNVISALGDEKKRKEGGHVPYRDSKLTRLLQDSLGGNSRTVMIACVSPADVNMDETLNTLKYANRARNIKNKPVVNRDPATAETARLKQQMQLLQAELLCAQATGGGDSTALRQHASQLEAENLKLRRDLRLAQLAAKSAEAQVLEAQQARDKVRLQLEAVQNGGTIEDAEKTMGVVEGHLATIRHLEAQLQDVRLRQGARAHPPAASRTISMPVSYATDSPGSLATPPNATQIGVDSPMLGETIEECAAREEAEAVAEAKSWEHRLAQERMDQELQDLNKKLEEKEEQMTRATLGDQRILALKTNYERVLKELEEERQQLQGERDRLLSSLNSMAGKCDAENSKLKENYRTKIKSLEDQLSELKRKKDAEAQLMRLKQRSDESAKRLQEEIQRIKSQKVQLQRKMKLESDQFQSWRISHEKEVGQLRKAGRRNEYEMHKLQALHQRQQKVLQRKTEEAAVATKRLKEVLAARKPLPKEAQPQTAGGTLAGKSAQHLKAWLEREIEVCVRVQDVRAALERELARRKESARQLAAMKDSGPLQSPRKAAAKIAALQAEVAARSASIAELQAQLLSVEEGQKGLSNPSHRWLHVRTMPEARTLLNVLFATATHARCQVQSLSSDLEYSQAQVAQYEAEEEERRRAKSATQLALLESYRTSPRTGLNKGIEQLQRNFDAVNPKPLNARFGSASPISTLSVDALERKSLLTDVQKGDEKGANESLQKANGKEANGKREGVKAPAVHDLPRGETDGSDWVSDMDTDSEPEDPTDKEYVPGLFSPVQGFRRRRAVSGESTDESAPGKKLSKAKKRPQSASEIDDAKNERSSEVRESDKKASKAKKRPQSASECGEAKNDRSSESDKKLSKGKKMEEAKNENEEGCECNGMCKRKCACRTAGGLCGPHCGCSSARCANRLDVEAEAVDPAAEVAAITMDLAEAMETVELEAALVLGRQSSASPETEEDESEPLDMAEEARGVLARHGAMLTQAWLEGAEQKREPLGAIDRNATSQAARLGAAKQKRRLYKLANLEAPPPVVIAVESIDCRQKGAPQNDLRAERTDVTQDPPNLHVEAPEPTGWGAPPIERVSQPLDVPDAPLGESSPNLAPRDLNEQAPNDHKKRSSLLSETPTARRLSGSVVHTVSPAQQRAEPSTAATRYLKPPKESPSKEVRPKWASKKLEGGLRRWEDHDDKENQRF